MDLVNHLSERKFSFDKKDSFIAQKVKGIVHQYDEEAEIILFGSRARGDWHEESDWDFLVLSDKKNIEELNEQIRRDVLNLIELVSFDNVFILVKNRRTWEDDYKITGLYQSISEEGLRL